MTAILEKIEIQPTTKEFQGPNKGNHEDGYTMAREIYARLRLLPVGWQPGAAIHEIKEDRRGRRKEIQHLQEKIREIPVSDRGPITEGLNYLQSQQFATRLIIKHFERGGVK